MDPYATSQASYENSRFDYIVQDSYILEVKDYNWASYENNDFLQGIASSSFQTQGEKYKQYVGKTINTDKGEYTIKGLAYLFSSRPPAWVFAALEGITNFIFFLI